MSPRVRKVRKGAPHPGGSFLGPAVLFLLLALALIVVLIEWFCSPCPLKEAVAAGEGVSAGETEGSVPPAPHPRSHLFY